MKEADLVIVGGSAAGIEAAIVASRHYMIDNMVVVRREEKVLVPCGIPYIFGTLGVADKNVMPDTLLGGAELVVDDVTAIDRAAQTVSTAGGETIGYKRLLLAVGARPVLPPIAGIQLENVFTIAKDIDYLQDLQKVLQGSNDLVIVGGGFIGVEFADECRKMGLNVTIVETLPHCLLLALDEEICSLAEDKLRERGIRVITGNAVRSIHGENRVKSVELSDGEMLEADVVIVAIGVSPQTDLARAMGLEIGPQRAIQVDARMRTNDPAIFAAGDCAEKLSFFTKKPSALRLASIATNEARLAVMNFFEPRRMNPGAIGVFSTIVGDLAFCAAGLTERAAREAGFDLLTAEASAPDRHPGGMPGASALKVKLVFERESEKMLGGQASGGTSIGELANVMAALITAGSNAEDVATFQAGTHPALTASPIVYPLVDAAEQALVKSR